MCKFAICQEPITVFVSFFLLLYLFCVILFCVCVLLEITIIIIKTPTNASINHAIFYGRLSNFLVRVTSKIPDKTLSPLRVREVGGLIEVPQYL